MAKKFEKLTRPNTRKLAPGQKLIEHGIEFERLPNGDGRYLVNIMVNGQRIHRVVGNESDGTTRNDAEEFIEERRIEAKQGRSTLPKGRKLHLNFAEAAKQYVERMEQSGGKDLKSKRHRIRDHLTPFFGTMIISKISTFDIDRYKKHRLEQKKTIERKIKKPDGKVETVIEYRPYQAATINRELLTLSHILNKAVEWGWIQFRPCTIKQLKEPEGRIVYLTVEQANDLLAEAKKDDCRAIYPFILIGLETGMRRMEILSIALEHIDLERRIIHIPKAKAGSREQPITSRLASYLKDYIASLPSDEKWLFPTPESKTGHRVTIEKPFRRVVEKAGLDAKEVTRHTLRHTAISHLVQAGVDLPTVKRISGHKTLQMVERYSHQHGDHIQAAMDKLEARYLIQKMSTSSS